MAKRGHGEGTVFERKDRPGVWRAQFSYADPVTGKTKRKNFDKSSKEKALAAGEEWIRQTQYGILPESRELFIKFKQQTGYNARDIAKAINTSRGSVNRLTKSKNFNSKSAACMWMCIMIDKKITELESKIYNLKELKGDIYKSIANSEVII